MTDHNGVLMMQRVLLAGTLGLTMAQKAAAILEGKPDAGLGVPVGADQGFPSPESSPESSLEGSPESGSDGAVLRAILDAASECLGHFDDRPPGERWCDTLFHLLDLAAFASQLG